MICTIVWLHVTGLLDNRHQKSIDAFTSERYHTHLDELICSIRTLNCRNLTAKWSVIWPAIISQSLPQKTQQCVPWLLDIHHIFTLIYCLEWQLYFLHDVLHISVHGNISQGSKELIPSLFSGLISNLKLHCKTDAIIRESMGPRILNAASSLLKKKEF